MKTTFIPSLVIASALLGAAGAQVPGLLGPNAATAEEVGTLPKQKEQSALSSRLAPESRNPFATRTSDTGPSAAVSQTEESRIRAVLEKFVVNGIAKDSGGSYSAQLQSIILKEGELLPQVIIDQVDELRVTKITPRLIEITWVGDEDAASPRKITRPVDMTPKIPIVLPSAIPGEKKMVAAGPPLTAQNDRIPDEFEVEEED